MPPPTPHPDGRLCERCGYRLATLPDHGQCPECGLAIRDSIPSLRRPGSPWQQRPSPWSWLTTGALLFTRPRQTFDAVRLQGAGQSLLWVNIFLAGFPWAIAALLLKLNQGGPELRDLTTAAFFLLCIWFPLPILTLIEVTGLRFFGRQRGWRITPQVAWTVCAHASYAWALCGLLLALGYAASQLRLDLNFGRWLDTQLTNLLGPATASYFRPFREWLGPAIGAYLGLLAFETLVYLGVRRCRYANPPEP
jgi:hypothetical protein